MLIYFLIAAVTAAVNVNIYIYTPSSSPVTQALVEIDFASLTAGCGNEFSCSIVPTTDTSTALTGSIDSESTRGIVLCGNAFKDSALDMAIKLSGLWVILLDATEFKLPEALPPNLSVLKFDNVHAGYLAGVVSGLVGNSIGLVHGKPTIAMKQIVNGFKAGVGATCPTCEIISFEFEPSTPTQTIIASVAAANQTVDVQFNALDVGAFYKLAWQTFDSSISVWASERGAYVVGVDMDQKPAIPYDNSKFLVRSVVKSYGDALSLALTAVSEGEISTILDIPTSYTFISEVNYKDPKISAIFDNLVLQDTQSCDTENLISVEKRLESIILNYPGTITTPDGNSLNNFVVTPFGSRPPPTWKHSMTPTDDGFVIFGGQDGTGKEISSLWKFDYPSNTWSLLNSGSNGPAARESHAAAYHSKKLFIFGGITDQLSLCDLWSYSFETNSWQEIDTTKEFCRGRASFASKNGILYLHGGYDETYIVSDDLLEINLDSGVIKVLPKTGDVPGGLVDGMMTILGDTIYLFGGMLFQVYSNKFFAYSTTSTSWENIPPRNYIPPFVSKGAMLSIDNNRILVLGGMSTGGFSKLSFVYLVKQNIWVTDSGPLPNPSVSHAVAVYMQQESSCQRGIYTICNELSLPALLLYGGHSVNGPSSSLLMYLIGPEPPEVSNCSAGFYLGEDQFGIRKCTPCPELTFNTDGGECLDCPFGGVCPGGKSVLVDKMFWVDKISLETSPAIYKCPLDTCCKEEACNLEDMCKFGTTGPLCSQCVDPNYKMWASECVDCSKANGLYFFLLILLCMIAVFAMTFVGEYGPLLANFIFAYQAQSLALENGHLQSAIACMTRFDAEITLSVVADGLDKCLAPIEGLGRGLVRLFFAILPLLIFGLYVISARFVKSVPTIGKIMDKKAEYFAEKASTIALISALPIFLSISSILSCRPISYHGIVTNRLTQFPDAECSGAEYAAAVAIISIFIIAPIIGAFVFVLEKLANKKPLGLIGVVFEKYSIKLKFWFFIEFIERSIIGIVAAYTKQSEVEYSFGIFFAALIMIGLNEIAAPYKAQRENFSKMLMLVSIAGLAATNLTIAGERLDWINVFQVIFLILPLIVVALRVLFSVFGIQVAKKTDTEKKPLEMQDVA